MPWIGVTSAFVTVAVGVMIRAAGGQLGAGFPPFTMYWGPQVYSLGTLLLAVAVSATAVAVAPVMVSRIRSPVAFAAWLYALTLALGLAVNVVHGGSRGWYAAFAIGRGGSVEGRYEYLPGLPWLRHGVGYYIGHFSSLLPHLPVHVQGNPPGPLVALHLLAVASPTALATLCIATGALVAPLAYDLGRKLGTEQRGRVAGTLTAASPSVLLFGVTSADYVFAALGVAVACLFIRRHPAAVAAGAGLAALATFCSWVLFAIPAWAALVAWQRDGWRSALRITLFTVLAVAVFNGALAAAYGYDPLATVRATVAASSSEPIHAVRSYAYWIFGSPTAWAIMLGPATTWFALRGLADRDGVAIATFAIVSTAAILGLTRGETERIWLPFVPLACVSAAEMLSSRKLRPLLLALVSQALAVEVLFFTVW